MGKEFESKYLKMDNKEIQNLKNNIISAKRYLDKECTLGQEAIVSINYTSSMQPHIAQLILLSSGYMSFEEYHKRFGDNQNENEKLVEVDNLLELMTEELESLVEYYGILPKGYAIRISWFKDNICTLLGRVL